MCREVQVLKFKIMSKLGAQIPLLKILLKMTSLAAAIAELSERVEEAEARIWALEDNQETLFNS